MPDVELEQHRAFAGVVDVLEAIGADYVIWGGVAAVAYGEQRFTHDMDVVIRLKADGAHFMAKALEEDGYHVSLPSMLDALQGGYFEDYVSSGEPNPIALAFSSTNEAMAASCTANLSFSPPRPRE